MTTIGWFLVLMAFVVARFATKGRGIADVPGDVGDLLMSVITGKNDETTEVLARTGTGNDPVATHTNSAGLQSSNEPFGEGGVGGSFGTAKGAAVLAEMIRLGDGKPYRLGATGPNAYDCSGLVYRAMVNVAGYNGVRFVTASWPTIGPTVATKVDTPTVGDIVRWRGHMGVVDGDSTFYSALSPKSGIKSLAMKYLNASNGTPSFWRLK